MPRSLRARRGLVARLTAAARAARDPARPLVWLHAPSVGEGLQARPVAQLLRTRHPEWQQAYTFFSPSAERFAASVGADFTDYLPFDRARDADALLDALQPSALVFAKCDVWPVLVERAVARGVPVAIISATMAEGSGRRGWWSRQVLQDAYASLAAVGAIDAAHGARLRALGVPAAACTVTGDTRFDQVWSRAGGVDHAEGLLASLASARPTLVAGSTWPADEAVLLPAWRQVRAAHPAARLIIAPHEPTAAHCAPISTWASQHGLTLQRLSAHATDGPHALVDADVVLVDRVGVLGDLYALADAAYVGGGFHAAGLHSVIEPAAFGAPVCFGPRHRMSREAGLLLTAGGGTSVDGIDVCARTISAWLRRDAAREHASHAARATVEAERGATERSVALIEHLVAERLR